MNTTDPKIAIAERAAFLASRKFPHIHDSELLGAAWEGAEFHPADMAPEVCAYYRALDEARRLNRHRTAERTFTDLGIVDVRVEDRE